MLPHLNRQAVVEETSTIAVPRLKGDSNCSLGPRAQQIPSTSSNVHLTADSD